MKGGSLMWRSFNPRVYRVGASNTPIYCLSSNFVSALSSPAGLQQ